MDGHFQKAGFSPNQILECPGSINHFKCIDNCSNRIWPAEPSGFCVNVDLLMVEGELLTCPNCSAVARPKILMFYDNTWEEKRAEEQ